MTWSARRGRLVGCGHSGGIPEAAGSEVTRMLDLSSRLSGLPAVRGRAPWPDHEYVKERACSGCRSTLVTCSCCGCSRRTPSFPVARRGIAIRAAGGRSTPTGAVRHGVPEVLRRRLRPHGIRPDRPRVDGPRVPAGHDGRAGGGLDPTARVTRSLGLLNRVGAVLPPATWRRRSLRCTSSTSPASWSRPSTSDDPFGGRRIRGSVTCPCPPAASSPSARPCGGSWTRPSGSAPAPVHAQPTWQGDVGGWPAEAGAADPAPLPGDRGQPDPPRRGLLLVLHRDLPLVEFARAVRGGCGTGRLLGAGVSRADQAFRPP